MPKFNEKSRYSYYTVKQKHNKNVVRSLHYLTNYNYILKEKLLDKDEEPCYKLAGIDFKSEFIKNDVVYKKETAIIELSDYDIVINEIDCLALNVNAKNIKLLKEFLDQATIFKVPDGNKKSTALFDKNKKELFITFIANKLYVSKKYALRIYNQIYSRIQFRYFQELYTKPTAVFIQGNTIKPILLDELQELKVLASFILRFKWLFDEPILNELIRRREQYRIDEKQRKKYIAATADLDRVNGEFNFNLILDTDDKPYNDAIQILTMSANNAYEVKGWYNCIHVNWGYEFSDVAKMWYKEEEENPYINVDEIALNYILEFNEKYKNEYPIIYEAISGKNDLKYDDDYYSDIVDSETYNDESNTDDSRQNALSFDKQWDNTFKLINEMLKSDDIEINKYLYFIKLAQEVNIKYDELLKDDPNFFSKKGKVTRNKYYRLIDDDYYHLLKKHNPDTPTKEIQKIKFKLMKLKRAKWELTYKLANIPAVRDIDLFNIETLQFLNMDDCPF